MTRKKLLFIIGTRPEAIKMAPLIKQTEIDGYFEIWVCVTAQHRQMLDGVLSFFEIKPHYDLNLMQPNQDLFDITTVGLNKLKVVIQRINPDLVLVQGDTTTTFIGALAAFYYKVRVAHIEAGLRSGDKNSPYPEEIYRTLAGHISDYHFAPTKNAAHNLARENIVKNVHVVGNTVVDALLYGLSLIKRSSLESSYHDYFNFLDFNKKIILITNHRRESFGKPMENVFNALRHLAIEYPDIQFVFPVHMNPNVKEPVSRILNNITNIFLIQPLDYSHMIWIMDRSYIIITDSGGIQEEAPSLGKPILVTREVTERIEGIEAGTAKLVGTDKDVIINETVKLLNDANHYKTMSQANNPYGDGLSCKRILNILKESV